MGLVEYLRTLFGDQSLTLTAEPALRFSLEDYLDWKEQVEESE
ncbi:hypothetical protein [Kyrpidia spormannii]|nr:hypothetical protein [Kyrpidia spormannii]